MVLSSTKANTKYAFKHTHKQKTRKHLFKRINKSATYKNKNNKRTYKQRTLRGGAGALGAGGVHLPEIKAVKAIVVIGGYGGTISRTLLNDLNMPDAAKTFDIFYFARTKYPNDEENRTQMSGEQLANPNKPIFCKCDLNSQDGLISFVENLKAILDAYTKTFIINCAADKDSSIVIKNYENGNATYNNVCYKTNTNSKNTECNSTLNLSIGNPTNDWHWTMHVAKSLAELCNNDTYKTKLHLIHLSTVYVNRGAFLQGKEKWSNDYVNYDSDSKKDYTSSINTDDPVTDPLGKLSIQEDPASNTTTTFYNIDLQKVPFLVDAYNSQMKKNAPPPMMNLYLYGLIKGLTEQIIKQHSGNNNNFVIIRLPVIMNEELTKLEETSPSLVINMILDKFTSLAPSSTPELKFDISHKRYPLTAQYVSKYIIKKILKHTIPSPEQWCGIKSICNKEQITKYDIASQFCNAISSVLQLATIKSIEQKTPYLPFSEVMDRDSSLDTDPQMLEYLTKDNIMNSILKGFYYYITNKTVSIKSSNNVSELPDLTKFEVQLRVLFQKKFDLKQLNITSNTSQLAPLAPLEP